jgi:DNA-binding MarR family transcriptional regulator
MSDDPKTNIPKVITKAEYEALAAFRYALRQFLRLSEEAAQEVGLTPQQHQALLAIRGFPDRERMTIGELAERLQIRHHSTVGLVDRLVALGLVERQAATTDRRQVYVALTPQGIEILERLMETHWAEMHHLRLLLRDSLDRLMERSAQILPK